MKLYLLIKMMKNALFAIIKTLYNSYMYIINRIMIWWTRKGETRESTDEEDDWDEEIVDFLGQEIAAELEEDITEKPNRFKSIIEMYKKKNRYVINGDCISIQLVDPIDGISKMQYVALDENPNAKIYKGEISVMESFCALKEYKLRLTSVHARQLIKDDSDYSSINSYIIAKTSNLPKYDITMTIKPSEDVQWYTFDLIQNKYIFVTARVNQTIMGYVKIRGRQVLTTLAVIIVIDSDNELVMYGSMVIVNKFPFVIVGYVKNESMYTIVAWAAMNNKYTCKINNNEVY